MTEAVWETVGALMNGVDRKIVFLKLLQSMVPDFPIGKIAVMHSLERLVAQREGNVSANKMLS